MVKNVKPQGYTKNSRPSMTYDSSSPLPLRPPRSTLPHPRRRRAYLHSRTNNADKREVNPQAFGRFLTAKSVVYPGPGRLVTLAYVAGEPKNACDGDLHGIRDPQTRASVVVLGFTPPGVQSTRPAKPSDPQSDSGTTTHSPHEPPPRPHPNRPASAPPARP